MARHRQEAQQQAFEGLSLEAVLRSTKKGKPPPLMSNRRMSLGDADGGTAANDA
jgi:hypothetical protein